VLVDVTRGSFLKLCGAALLGQRVDASPWLAAAGGQAPFVDAGPRRDIGLNDPSAAMFRRHLNTTFRVRMCQDAHVRLILARVEDGPACADIDQFSLLFHGPAAADLLHGTYAFRHSQLGAFDLFIAPIGVPDRRRSVYEACFSRLVRSAGEHTACPINS
jgi:hypothetical protein